MRACAIRLAALLCSIIKTPYDEESGPMEDDSARKPVDCAALIAGAVREPLIALGPDGRVKAASAAFCKMFALAPQESQGRPFFEIDGGQWNHPPLRHMIETVLPSTGEFHDFHFERELPAVGPRLLAINARRLPDVD